MMTKRTLTIATRQSLLAMWQSEWVRDQLLSHFPELTIKFLKLTTAGDLILDKPLAKVGGKGLFVKELEQALLDGRADMAVHSMKDVPMHLPEGLEIAAVCERDQPEDAFISNSYTSFEDLPAGAIVGTSSLRRQAQCLQQFPHLQVRSVRGNVPTRLKKLDEGGYDALIMASVGLKRLGLGARIKEILPVENFIPCAGQGIVGIECRANDKSLKAYLNTLTHKDSADCVHAERAVAQFFNAGCEVPLGAYAIINKDMLYLRAFIASSDGKKVLTTEGSGNRTEATEIGIEVAKQLLAMGGGELLKSV